MKPNFSLDCHICNTSRTVNVYKETTNLERKGTIN